MKKLKLFTPLILTAALLLSVSAFSVSVAAPLNPFDKVCNNANADDTDRSFACQTQESDPVNTTLGKATNILAFITGVAAVIVIIIGGFQYITSAGDSTKVAKAKDMIIYAAVGLVIVAAARTIIMFVISRL
jgi:Type IV secretion system pilin